MQNAVLITMTPRFTDGLTVVAANVFNLLVVGVFLARAAAARRVEWLLGLAASALGLSVLAAPISNIVHGRPWWTIIFPALPFCYCLMEFVLDYILKSEFRWTRFLPVYLGIFYLASLAIVGYSFGVSGSLVSSR